MTAPASIGAALNGLSIPKLVGEVGGLGVAGAGFGLFNYNRGYFKADQKMHWSRFCFVNKMAIAQTKQYREDIADMAELTSTKMDMYHQIAVMGLTIITALFCPGRLGLHTPPPPSWLMGLWHTNVAGCYLFLGLTMWLAMHASLKADSAATHMLTRMVRLPVPSQRALDRARKLMHTYEEQPWQEIFRLPFVMGHSIGKTKDAKVGKFVDGAENADNIDQKALRRTRNKGDVPFWFQKERNIDESYAVETLLPRLKRGSAPEHFEVFRVIQADFWPYDIYARISIFLAHMYLFSGWSFYQMGHTIQELRAPFATVCLVVPLFVGANIMISLDILTPKNDFPLHRLGPLSMITGLFGSVLEYKRWYSQAGIYFTCVFAMLSYIFTIIYTIMMIRLCSPDWDTVPEAQRADMDEKPGNAWWPKQWCLPSGWAHSVWLVAPPQQLQTGEVDLVEELRKGSETRRNAGSVTSSLTPEEKKADVHRALGRHGETPAWRMVQTGLVAMLIAWIWLTLGCIVDFANEGTVHPSLLNAPGLPNNLRDPRYRPAKPGFIKAQEVGSGGYEAGPSTHHLNFQMTEGHHGGEHHRRLQQIGSASRHEIAEKLRALLPILDKFHANPYAIESMPARGSSSAPVMSIDAPVPVQTNVDWPALLEPRLLACRPRHEGQSERHIVAALSRSGRGAIVSAHAQLPSDASEQPSETTPFMLEGAAAFGPFLAASWDDHGLLLTTATGSFLDCPGHGPSSAGRWRCQPMKHIAKLPLGLSSGPFSGALAITRTRQADSTETSLRAAVVFPGETAVTLFSHGGKEGTPWLPAGEARAQSHVTAASFSHHSLMLILADGSVTRMRLSDGAVAQAAAPVGGPANTWQATCGLASGDVARLGVRPSGLAAWDRTLLLGA
mmetsp:Transcript_31751/g.57843  ORF Transcript_31751/g.57843 Transcript_31751/m.57843 type:complete len:898 (+) Transcript_31751:73-2766(+)